MVWEWAGGRALVSHGAAHHGSTEFGQSLIPFFDSYAQASALHAAAQRACAVL